MITLITLIIIGSLQVLRSEKLKDELITLTTDSPNNPISPSSRQNQDSKQLLTKKSPYRRISNLTNNALTAQKNLLKFQINQYLNDLGTQMTFLQSQERLFGSERVTLITLITLTILTALIALIALITLDVCGTIGKQSEASAGD